MTKKICKKGMVSLAIMEMKFKVPVKQPLILIRMTLLKEKMQPLWMTVR